MLFSTTSAKTSIASSPCFDITNLSLISKKEKTEAMLFGTAKRLAVLRAKN